MAYRINIFIVWMLSKYVCFAKMKDEFTIYNAPSLIPNAGLCLLTTESINKNEKVGEGAS